MRAGGLKILLLLILIAPSTSAQAGPWSKDLGQFYVKIGENIFVASSFTDSSGLIQSGADFVGLSTFLYFEVGLWKGLQIQAYLPWAVAWNNFDDGAKFLQSKGGDAVIGLQWSLPWTKPVATAIRLNVKVPMYKVNGVTGYLADRFPALGDGQIDVTLWASVGGSIPGVPIYLYGELGYRFRTETFVGPSDERTFNDSIAFNAQIGWSFFRRMTLMLNFGGVLPAKKNVYTKGYLTLGPQLYLPFWRGMAFEISYDPVIWVNNSSKGHGISVGLSYNFGQ